MSRWAPIKRADCRWLAALSPVTQRDIYLISRAHRRVAELLKRLELFTLCSLFRSHFHCPLLFQQLLVINLFCFLVNSNAHLSKVQINMLLPRSIIMISSVFLFVKTKLCIDLGHYHPFGFTSSWPKNYFHTTICCSNIE